jgi:hypothetical protein
MKGRVRPTSERAAAVLIATELASSLSCRAGSLEQEATPPEVPPLLPADEPCPPEFAEPPAPEVPSSDAERQHAPMQQAQQSGNRRRVLSMRSRCQAGMRPTISLGLVNQARERVRPRRHRAF